RPSRSTVQKKARSSPAKAVAQTSHSTSASVIRAFMANIPPVYERLAYNTPTSALAGFAGEHQGFLILLGQFTGAFQAIELLTRGLAGDGAGLATADQPEGSGLEAAGGV